MTLGIDGMKLLNMRDPTEYLVTQAVIKKADEEAAKRDKSLANKIASEVSKLF